MRFMQIFKPKTTNITGHIVGGELIPAQSGSPFDKFHVRSLVGGGMVIDGNIMSQNGAALDGVVNGDVRIAAPNAALLIREGAQINGNTKAPIVLVRGRVNGDIDARFVRLYPGSLVSGRIRAGRLVVDDGAIIANDSLGVGAAEPPSESEVAAPQLGVVKPRPRPLTPDEKMQEILAAASMVNRKRA